MVHVPCGPFSQGYPAFGAPAHGLRAAIRNAQTWLEGTEGPLFDVRFAPRAGEFVVGGRVGTSALVGSNLDMYLRNHRISHVCLAGFASHVCVDATMRAAADLGYDVSVLTDASAAFSAQIQSGWERDVLHHFAEAIKVRDFASRVLSGRLLRPERDSAGVHG